MLSKQSEIAWLEAAIRRTEASMEMAVIVDNFSDWSKHYDILWKLKNRLNQLKD